MRYPKGVQEKINVLKIYDLNIELTEYNIFHLYPKGLAYPNGYYDSRFFNLVGYNSETMEYREIRISNELDFSNCKNKDISMIRIFRDGSTFIRFNSFHKINDFCQSVYIY